MSGDYDNTNRGALFVNNRKQTPNHPDRTGTINVDGVEYWISGWLKDGRNGKYLSLSVTPKDGQASNQRVTTQNQKPTPKSPGFDDNYDDDIPF